MKIKKLLKHIDTNVHDIIIVIDKVEHTAYGYVTDRNRQDIPASVLEREVDKFSISPTKSNAIKVILKPQAQDQ